MDKFFKTEVKITLKEAVILSYTSNQYNSKLHFQCFTKHCTLHQSLVLTTFYYDLKPDNQADSY